MKRVECVKIATVSNRFISKFRTLILSTDNYYVNMQLKRQKIFSGNHKPHVSKSLRLAVMKRSRSKNKANKTQLPRNKQNYRKQRNLVFKINKQFKKRIIRQYPR